LGHNQGNAHNAENAVNQPGSYPDSYGYRVRGIFRDIMSYVSDIWEPRIPYFSNPNVSVQTGVDSNGNPVFSATGVLDLANTARSLSVNAPIVASFRTVTNTVPAAPLGLSARATAVDSISLSWTDQATDETGYVVERTLDGSNWSQVASLAQNSSSFTHTGLTGGTTYFYRIYAFNGFGSSLYSNTVSAITPLPVPPSDTTPPVVTIASPLAGTRIGSSVQISAAASDNVAINNLALYLDGKLTTTSTSGSLSYTWNTKRLKAGPHTILIEATDSSGNKGRASVSVTK
jgi:hypothetical protein